MNKPRFLDDCHRRNVAETLTKLVNAFPRYNPDYLKGLCLIVNPCYGVNLRPYMKFADWEVDKMNRKGQAVPFLKDDDGNVAYMTAKTDDEQRMTFTITIETEKEN